MPPPFFLRKNYVFINKASSIKNLADQKFNYFVQEIILAYSCHYTISYTLVVFKFFQILQICILLLECISYHASWQLLVFRW